ncbi:MAG: alpha/beta hydrolase [Betaproteobacteria bacterium]|jgi:alpha/beta superfamily hydrolase|nr:MAG: alpha/beta hydrolase [Betaproteobacteria bacterium SG8_41]UCF74340.1 MAG: alpha/beta hydrolase [Betaproteobacteria bacterium]
MPSSSLTRVVIDGPAGGIETDINDPGDGRRGIALVAHPNPVQGGTKDNKVVTTLAKTFFALGYVAARPNFRGVGASEGAFDQGRGETEDLIAVAAHLKRHYGKLPVVLAGFSFGAFVQTRAARRIHPQRMVLVGAAVNRFKAEGVPADTLVVHGEHDDVVPLAAVLDWARPQHLPIVVVPGGEHFFHGRLGLLAEIVVRHFHP